MYRKVVMTSRSFKWVAVCFLLVSLWVFFPTDQGVDRNPKVRHCLFSVLFIQVEIVAWGSRMWFRMCAPCLAESWGTEKHKSKFLTLAQRTDIIR